MSGGAAVASTPGTTRMLHKGVTTMTYHTRKDLPYHYALADAFTICDNYHCSVMGPTAPPAITYGYCWVQLMLLTATLVG